MKIGKEIKRLREEKGMSIRQLADKTGVIYSSIPAIESGKTDIRVGTLIRIAKGLGVSPEEILIGAKKMPEKFA